MLPPENAETVILVPPASLQRLQIERSFGHLVLSSDC